MFKIEIESVGETKEDALNNALKVIGMMLTLKSNSVSCGGTNGSAVGKVTEENNYDGLP